MCWITGFSTLSVGNPDTNRCAVWACLAVCVRACLLCSNRSCAQVRCIITGPQDTPYEGGLFVFDVFFPAGYPNVPPLMVLETTGDGRARFNPNLYAGERTNSAAG